MTGDKCRDKRKEEKLFEIILNPNQNLNSKWPNMFYKALLFMTNSKKIYDKNIKNIWIEITKHKIKYGLG